MVALYDKIIFQIARMKLQLVKNVLFFTLVVRGLILLVVNIKVPPYIGGQ